MTTAVLSDARRFVRQAKLPAAPVRKPLGGPKRGAARPEPAFESLLDAGKDQAAVVGSELIAFVKGVTVERREAIVNSGLLAQLVANKKVPDRSKIYDWYKEYFDVLANIGWAIQETSFAEYAESSGDVEAHEAIIKVAAAVLGPAAGALALVTTTLESLKSMNADSPWITLFRKESQSAKTARFQVTLAQEDEAGPFLVTVMAFGLEAKSKITQVLFFKVRKNEATLKHCSGKVTINTRVLDDVRPELSAKLSAHAQSFVKALPDL
ncbi:MAG TPA: hypothetical protein VFM14_02160 [Gemmatimonadales bacterium]|nr:hypothetical protein [Gemmatimonadales bacterium]